MNQHFDRAVCRLIGCAAGSAPAGVAERLHEEWLADVREQADPIARLRFALGCLWAALMIRHEGNTGAVLVSASALPAPLGMASGGRRRPLYAATDLIAEAPTICDINTTPLIDVLLVLLITLILALPLLNHAVKLELPQATTAMQITPPEVIDLDIDFDGALEWNGTPVASAQLLEGYFRNQSRKDPQPEVRIHPNRHVKYDFVAKVLASAQRNGMRKVGIENTVEFAQ